MASASVVEEGPQDLWVSFVGDHLEESQVEVLSEAMSPLGQLLGWGVLLGWLIGLCYVFRGNRLVLTVIGLSVLMRVGFMVVNTYFSTMGVDPFERVAVKVAEYGWDGLVANFGMNHRVYSSVCSVVYILIGRNPLMLQVINVILSVHTVLIMFHLVWRIKGRREALLVGLFLSVLPTLVIFSTAILRDAMNLFFLATAITFLERASRELVSPSLWLSGLGFLGVLMLHKSGMIGILVWTVFTIVVAVKSIRSSGGLREGSQWKHLIPSALILVVCGLILFEPSGETSVSKTVENVSFNPSALKEVSPSGELVSLADARASYLMNEENSTLRGKIKNLPERAAYFLFAPFPWMISNIKDVVGFCDSLIHVFIIAAILWLLIKRAFKLDSFFEAALYVCMVAGFAVAVSNYGTASRHRLKLLMPGIPVLVAALPVRQRKAEELIPESE